MDLAEQISAIGMTSDPDASPAEQPNPEAPVEGQQPAQTPETAPPETPDPLKEIDLLKRVIATDPNMRDRYVSEKLGVPYYAPQPQYQAPSQQPAVPQQPVQQPPALPFDLNDYDPTNAEHQQALLTYTVSQQLQQALAPFAQFVQQQQAENQYYQQQQAVAMVGELETKTRQAMDSHLPGFTALATAQDQGKATPEQEMLLNHTYQMFDQELKRNYSQQHWRDPRIQQEVIRTIAPTVKSLADRLGIFSPAPPPLPPKPGAYVEPSAAVPQVKANAFDAAYKGFQAGNKNDLRGMISAIGKTV